MPELSLAETWAQLPESEREAIFSNFTEDDWADLKHDWSVWARPKQLAPPGDWLVWLLLAGRGWGKTRTGAEHIRDQIEHHGRRRVALVGPTAADVRDTMVVGPSGLMQVCSPRFRPKYEPTKRLLTWPNGAEAHTYSADEPDRLRGPEHDYAWCDELAAWRYAETAWGPTGLMGGLRQGQDPRVVVTTTPRPIPLIRELVADPTTAVTRGTSYENLHNLARAFVDKVIRRYEGTRMGRQELLAELLDDVIGALWTLAAIESSRARPPFERNFFSRIVVAVDPPISDPTQVDNAEELEQLAEAGIVVAGLGRDGHGYVLEDASGHMTPLQWATTATSLYHYYQADRLIAEVNQGGAMVEHTIKTADARVPVMTVQAYRGKLLRAEPVAALYEQGKVHHLGSFPKLEDQMRMWQPGTKSPDRLDAAVYALTELMLQSLEPAFVA